MTLDELTAACKANSHVYLVNTGLRAPFSGKGWPKGTLMCNNSAGNSVWLYDSARLLAALEKQMTQLDVIVRKAVNDAKQL